MTLMYVCGAEAFALGPCSVVSVYAAVALFPVHTLSAHSSCHATVTLVQWNASRNNGGIAIFVSQLLILSLITKMDVSVLTVYFWVQFPLLTIKMIISIQNFLVGLISTPDYRSGC
jgi:ABC-type transport system involved in Fe-S cluster assembly fused permease/ATPase subunit